LPAEFKGTAKGMKRGKVHEVYLEIFANKENGQFEINEATEDGKPLAVFQLMVTFAFSGNGGGFGK
jgi:hypothetical protein